jgi:hypothetical protein
LERSDLFTRQKQTTLLFPRGVGVLLWRDFGLSAGFGFMQIFICILSKFVKTNNLYENKTALIVFGGLDLLEGVDFGGLGTVDESIFYHFNFYRYPIMLIGRKFDKCRLLCLV